MLCTSAALIDLLRSLFDLRYYSSHPLGTGAESRALSARLQELDVCVRILKHRMHPIPPGIIYRALNLPPA